MKPSILLLSYLLLTAFSCEKSTTTPTVTTPDSSTVFESTPLSYPIVPHIIDEASGLCDSRSMPGNLWVEEDGGNPNKIHLLTNQGKYLGSIDLPIYDRDWEDITIGAGPISGKTYIYLAEIGDNLGIYDNCSIYRFVEPKSLTETVTSIDKITFQYPDGSRDAETILLDPATKDIYIVSKREDSVHLYELPYPQSTTATITAKFITTMPYTYITSGGISPDGTEIILKSYEAVYYWKRQTNESIIQALSRPKDKLLPYVLEPQGEGFCFDKEGKGFYTISEIAKAASVSLFYYGRKK